MIHYCIQCGRESNDWMVEAGLVPAAYSWCGDCKRDFEKLLQAKVINALLYDIQKIVSEEKESGRVPDPAEGRDGDSRETDSIRDAPAAGDGPERKDG